ncbi:hypothetical protein [Cellulosilyticum sp. I15G10I2]|uniref:hypothetical protein n=1 Tax=Cellulosilyticum sp. I15G10I2 TaxID=1892843 RepID=UPI00085C2DF4|nr:hypothetical protein [Cellulosilyticum sp. I15G10I2]
MSQYIVITPDYEVVRIQGKQRVAEYIQQYYSEDMLNICRRRDLDYDELSIQNVRDEGLLIGGTDRACKIYDLEEVERKVNETFSAKEDAKAMMLFLKQLVLERALKCPGDLSDLLSETDELYAPDILDDYPNQV